MFMFIYLFIYQLIYIHIYTDEFGIGSSFDCKSNGVHDKARNPSNNWTTSLGVSKSPQSISLSFNR